MIDKNSLGYINLSEEEVLKKQEEWIETLQKLESEPILITSSAYNRITNELMPFGRRLSIKERHELGYYKRKISGRTVLSCEIVFENDNHDWSYMIDVTKKIVSYLDKVKIPYYFAYSGSKSIHIHIFFGRNAIKIDDDLIEPLKEFEIDVDNEIRIFLGEFVRREAGVEHDDIDWTNIDWRSRQLGSKGSIIRCIGTPRDDGKFKALINKIPEEKPTIEDLEFTFPERIGLWDPSLLNSQIIEHLRNVLKYASTPLHYEGREYKKLKGVESIAEIIPDFNEMKKVSESNYDGEHPIKEESEKKRYFAINVKKNTWYCFHHSTGGGILEIIAVMEGIVKCEDCKKGDSPLKGEIFKQVLKIAEEKYGIVLSGERGVDIDLNFKNDVFGVMYLKERKNSYIISITKGKEVLLGETIVPKNFLEIKKTRQDIFTEGKVYEKLEKNEFIEFIEVVRDRIEDALLLRKKEEKKQKERENQAAEKERASVEEIANEIMKYNNPLQFVINTVQLMHAGDEDLIALHLNSFLGANLSHRNHWLNVGTTGVGKTDEMRKCFLCLPPEWKFRVDSSSDKSFFYAAQAGKLQNKKFIFFDDITPSPGIIDTLKKFASDDPEELTHMTVSKDREYMEMKAPKEAVLMGTTIEALTDKQSQILRRYQICNPDESDEGKEKVRKKIKGEGRLPGKLIRGEYNSRIQVAQQIYREFFSKNFDVVIPYDIDYPIITHAQKTEFKGFMSLIKCITIANFKNRICVGDDILVANLFDFYDALKLWTVNLPLKVDTVATQVLECLPDSEPIYADAEEAAKDEGYYIPGTTTSIIARDLKIAPRTVRDKTDNLYAVGLIDRKQWVGRGKPWVFWKSPVVDSEIEKKLRKIEIPTIKAADYQSDFINALKEVNERLAEKEKFNVDKVVSQVFSFDDPNSKFENNLGGKEKRNPKNASLYTSYSLSNFLVIKTFLGLEDFNSVIEKITSVKKVITVDKWISSIEEWGRSKIKNRGVVFGDGEISDEKNLFISKEKEQVKSKSIYNLTEQQNERALMGEKNLSSSVFSPTAEDKDINKGIEEDLNIVSFNQNLSMRGNIYREKEGEGVSREGVQVESKSIYNPIEQRKEIVLKEESPHKKTIEEGRIIVGSLNLLPTTILNEIDDIKGLFKDTQIYSGNYITIDRKSVIQLFGRDTNNKKRNFIIHGFIPYFYAKDDEGDFTTLYGDKVQKIEVSHPWEIKKKRENYIHYEGDIPFVKRFLIDSNLTFPYIPPKILYFDFEEDINEKQPISMSYKINDSNIEFVYGRKTIVEKLEKILPYMDALCAWNLPYDLAWLKKLFSHEEDNFFEQTFICFDLLDLFKKVWKGGGLASYTLDNVGEVVLGKKKIKIEKKIWELPIEDLETYNRRDVELLYELDQKLNITNLYTLMSSKIGCFVNTTFNKSPLGDFLLLKKAKEKEIILPSKKYGEKEKKQSYKGAYRMATPGLYHNTLLFDISTAYPRIAINKNISPELDIKNTNEEEGFFPGVLKELLQLKESTSKDLPEYRVYKESLNALYGLLGASFSRIYSPKHAEAITQTLAEFMRSLNDDDIIYIDTDGILFTCDEEQAKTILNDRQRKFNIKFSFTKEIFDDIFIFGKTHYVARYKVNDNYEYQIRGIATRRGDAPLLLQQLLKESIKKLMDGISLKEIRKGILDRLNRITLEPLENIIIPKGLRKPLNEYKSNISQKRAYIYSKKYLGYEPNLRFDKIHQLYIKSVPEGYELTDIISLPPGGLPNGFIVNHDKHRDFILNGLKFLFESPPQVTLESEGGSEKK